MARVETVRICGGTIEIRPLGPGRQLFERRIDCNEPQSQRYWWFARRHDLRIEHTPGDTIVLGLVPHLGVANEDVGRIRVTREQACESCPVAIAVGLRELGDHLT